MLLFLTKVVYEEVLKHNEKCDTTIPVIQIETENGRFAESEIRRS